MSTRSKAFAMRRPAPRVWRRLRSLGPAFCVVKSRHPNQWQPPDDEEEPYDAGPFGGFQEVSDEDQVSDGGDMDCGATWDQWDVEEWGDNCLPGHSASPVQDSAPCSADRRIEHEFDADRESVAVKRIKHSPEALESPEHQLLKEFIQKDALDSSRLQMQQVQTMMDNFDLRTSHSKRSCQVFALVPSASPPPVTVAAMAHAAVLHD
eukprot:4756217-Amphidinium_carterae.1